MTAETRPNIGDKIWFRVACRWGWEHGPRIVRDVNAEHRVAFVRLVGIDGFVVRFDEITKIERR